MKEVDWTLKIKSLRESGFLPMVSHQEMSEDGSIVFDSDAFGIPTVLANGQLLLSSQDAELNVFDKEAVAYWRNELKESFELEISNIKRGAMDAHLFRVISAISRDIFAMEHIDELVRYGYLAPQRCK